MTTYFALDAYSNGGGFFTGLSNLYTEVNDRFDGTNYPAGVYSSVECGLPTFIIGVPINTLFKEPWRLKIFKKLEKVLRLPPL